MNGLFLRAASVVGVCCLFGLFWGTATAAMAAQQAEVTNTDPLALEEIIVTAQRREQNLQDVGITVNAFSSGQLEKMQIQSPHDLMFGVPGLVVSFSQGSNIPNFALRGVGLYDFAPNNSSPVAINLDDVYQSYSAFLNFGLYDVERVEVLKGPQGTLFGRNTTAGAVNIYTKAPTQQFEAAAKLSYGNYDAVRGEFLVNGGLSDSVSGRLSGFFKTQGSGPWYNRYYGRDVGKVHELWGLRGQLAFAPNERLSVNLNLHGGKERSESAQYNMLPALKQDGSGPCPEYLNGTLKGGEADCYDFQGNREPDSNPFTNSAGLINTQRLESYGAALHADYNFGPSTLTSVSAYDHLYRYAAEDADGFPQIIVDDLYENTIKQYSQELRLSSNAAGAAHWVLGGLLSRDEINTPRQEFLGTDFPVPGGLNAIYVQKTNAEAVFGHADWSVDDHVQLVGGLRYTHERRAFDGRTIATITGHVIGAPGVPYTPDIILASNDSSRSFSDLSWTGGINYKPTKDMLLYASASKGFKSGGYNGNLAFSSAELEPFGKETLIAYEVGAKATLFNGHLLWDTSAFHYDYSHIILQVGITSPLPGGGGNFTVFRLTNGSDARMNGFETDATWRPVTGLDLRLGLAYLDSHLQNAPAGNDAINSSVPAYAPKWSGNGSIRYQTLIASNLNGSLEFDGSYKGNFFERVPNTPLVAQDAYWIVNAKAEIGAASEKWAVALWAQNLTNTTYTQYTNDIVALGYILKTVGYPRTFGVELSCKW